MSYSQDKDRLIKAWEYKQENGSLIISVMSYNEGKPKLQMTRMYTKRSGEVGYGKSGRLSYDELQFIIDNKDEILENMKGG